MILISNITIKGKIFITDPTFDYKNVNCLQFSNVKTGHWECYMNADKREFVLIHGSTYLASTIVNPDYPHIKHNTDSLNIPIDSSFSFTRKSISGNVGVYQSRKFIDLTLPINSHKSRYNKLIPLTNHESEFIVEIYESNAKIVKIIIKLPDI